LIRSFLVEAAAEKLEILGKNAEPADYLTLVSDGEPTLDENLGELIRELKRLHLKTAVITNSSLLSRDDVRDDLMHADWVSVKADSADDEIWRKINRPHGRLSLDSILSGLQAFSGSFTGKLATETMLIRDVNDMPGPLEKTAAFIQTLSPHTAFLSVPTRPPAEKSALPPLDENLQAAWHLFSGRLLRVEYLTGYEGSAFASTGDFRGDLLSITAVHPMRKEAVQRLAEKTGEKWDTVMEMMKSGLIRSAEFGGEIWFSRNFGMPGKKRGSGFSIQS
jgi:wyosine [tRNA(Phe)-imidazoG37] synthetase (radical SAM superfamily)